VGSKKKNIAGPGGPSTSKSGSSQQAGGLKRGEGKIETEKPLRITRGKGEAGHKKA